MEILKKAIRRFFSRYILRPSTNFQTLRVFNITETEALHYKCYVLLYTAKHIKFDVQFNLTHRLKFTHDLLLQVGTKMPWEDTDTQACQKNFGLRIWRKTFYVIISFDSARRSTSTLCMLHATVVINPLVRQWYLYPRQFTNIKTCHVGICINGWCYNRVTSESFCVFYAIIIDDAFVSNDFFTQQNCTCV